MENKNINYIQILKDAWKITWKNRFLWWFGFFIAIGGGGMSSSRFNFSESEEDISPEMVEKMNYWWSMYWEWIFIGVVALFFVALGLYVLNIIGRGALISSLIKINNGGETNFSAGFNEGKKSFWKLFILNIVFGLAIILALAIIIFPIARLIFLEAYGAATMLGLIALPIIISIFILAAFLKIYSQIYLVGSGSGVGDSIKLAYGVFKKNIKGSVLMGLLLMVVGIIIGIGLVLIIIVGVIPLVVIGGLGYLINPMVAVGVGVLGLIALIVFVMIWQSAYMVFMQAVWIIFFSQIAKVSDENKENVIEELEEKVPEPGKA